MRHHYLHPQRENSGIVLPEFIVHAALSELPKKLATGYYGLGNTEEPIVRVVKGLSQSQIDSVFEHLRRKPPSVGLEFPASPQQLPAIFVITESMMPEAEILADDAGTVRPDINTFEGTHYLANPALGGETTFFIPSEGPPITSMVTLYRHISGEPKAYMLDPDTDFLVDAAKKEITLTTPLGVGDLLYATRWGSWGLPGGDLYATTFRATLAVFIDTENAVVTSVLKGLVWLELTLKAAAILSSGLADPSMSIRYQSIYEELTPALGHRAELVFNCLTSWLAYARTPTVKTLQADIADARDPATSVLEMNFPLVRWATTEEEEE